MSSYVVTYVSGLYSKRGKGFFRAKFEIGNAPSGVNTGLAKGKALLGFILLLFFSSRAGGGRRIF